MSTCPEKDIHSIYIDNELPPSYVAEYEAHVKACPKCQKQLNLLKSTRQIFSADSNNIKMTQATLDSSFERLQTKLSYSKVTSKSQNHITRFFNNNSIIHTVVGTAVAAAIITLVIPVRQIHKTNDNLAFQPIAKTQIKSPAQTEIKVDGAIQNTTLASLFSDQNSSTERNSFSPVLISSGNTKSVYDMASLSVPNILIKPKVNTTENLRSTLVSYDVFCPINENQNIPFKSNDSQTNVNSFLMITYNATLNQFTLEIGNKK